MPAIAAAVCCVFPFWTIPAGEAMALRMWTSVLLAGSPR